MNNNDDVKCEESNANIKCLRVLHEFVHSYQWRRMELHFCCCVVVAFGQVNNSSASNEYSRILSRSADKKMSEIAFQYCHRQHCLFNHIIGVNLNGIQMISLDFPIFCRSISIKCAIDSVSLIQHSFNILLESR